MIIFALFGQRKEHYEGEYAPELLLAWDEYSVEENKDGWEKELKKARAGNQDEMVSMRVIAITVNGDYIRKALCASVKAKGTLSLPQE